MCEICKQYPCHPRCPSYTPLKAVHYCSICDNGIYNGEDYIKNPDGEYAHYDCLTDLSFRAIIEWLGGEIKVMDDDYEEGY